MKKFEDYFDSEIEYPQDIVSDILPVNQLWSFISHTFLDAFINYVEIIDIICVGEISEHDLTGFKFKYHSKLSFFDENISVLAKVKDNLYIYFYYDFDVSDCEIGRFETSEEINTIIQKFRTNFSELHPSNTIIPKDYISGWVGFI